MLFIKSEGKPGQAWHQDELFIPTRDRSLAAAWIALDDATVENGCLWVLPGSHARGVL
jgi:ectoine hydroxylase-related dioxygenase (phytanoyl-CoA dioxygenase family)